MNIASIAGIDCFKYLCGETVADKFKKEVCIVLVDKTNLAIDVLFKFNSTNVLSTTIPVVIIAATEIVGAFLIKCKIQYTILLNTLRLRLHKQQVVSENSKLQLLLLGKICRNSKLAHLLPQTTNSLMRNLSADEGNAIVNGGWLKSVNIKETVDGYLKTLSKL
jgi:hypothetical protein